MPISERSGEEMMKSVFAGLTLMVSTAVISPVHAFCVYADRQYSDGATLCISPIASQTCTNSGSWSKLELPQTQANACERAYQIPSVVTLSVASDRKRE
jgi:hypothetical protein